MMLVSPLMEASTRPTDDGDVIPTFIHRCHGLVGSLMWVKDRELKWERCCGLVVMGGVKAS